MFEEYKNIYSKYNYIYELKYTNKNWRYDFYIKELDLYIELYGKLDPIRIQEKINYHKLNNIKCCC